MLLIEAGRDLPPGQEGSAIRDMYPGRAAFDPRNHWQGLMVTTCPFQENAPAVARRLYEQPRLMGGGSSINGQIANRGTPEDYDEWAALGATGWDWRSVLPYFKKLERDLDYSGPLHGTDGPIPSTAFRMASGPACRSPRRRRWTSSASRRSAIRTGSTPTAIFR